MKCGFHATYGNLLKVCCEGGDAYSAEAICDLLKNRDIKNGEFVTRLR